MRLLRQRFLRLLPVLLIVTFATFAMVRLLPGDPARAFLGPDAPQEQVEQLSKDMGLKDNVVVGYGKWIGKTVTGDLGASYRTGQDVSEALSQRFPVSLELMIFAQLFALILAIPIGVFTAYRAGGVIDRLWSASAFAIMAVPAFVLGLLLIYIFPVKLDWLQISGFTRLTEDLVGNIRSLILPGITLGLLQVAIYSRILRSDMIATLQEDYVMMARAKGLSTRRILLGHALRPSSFSLLTLAGLNIGQLLSGAVIVEYMFSLPGVGLLMVESIAAKELMMLQGAILVIVVGYVIINLLVDVLYSVLDPRIRQAGARV